ERAKVEYLGGIPAREAHIAPSGGERLFAVTGVNYVMNKLTVRCLGFAMLACIAICCLPAAAADLLSWNTNQNRVTADIKSAQLSSVLSKLSGATGWKVFLEPGTSQKVTTKFRNLPAAEA